MITTMMLYLMALVLALALALSIMVAYVPHGWRFFRCHYRGMAAVAELLSFLLLVPLLLLWRCRRRCSIIAVVVVVVVHDRCHPVALHRRVLINDGVVLVLVLTFSSLEVQ